MQVSAVSKLTKLDLNSNQLSGSIPSSFGNLSMLQYLGVYSNQLSGTIPSSLGDLTSLQYLYLDTNQFSGTIPSSLGYLSSLKRLYLNTNDLSGTIPPSLGKLSALQKLFLNTNQLSGTIPSSFGNLSSLQVLELNSNHLSGSIPSSLGKLSVLQRLNLNTNQLSGSIPSSLGNLPALQIMYLFTNQFSGTIPSSLGNLSVLQELFLNINQLSGTIPSSLGNLRALHFMYLNSNQLSGTIPSSLGDLQALQVLDLFTNQLSGTIPSALGNLSALQELSFRENQLSGTIPPSFGSLTFLNTLDLGDNFLFGNEVFRWLSRLRSLARLDLSSNLFSGNFDVFTFDFFPAFVNLSNNPLGPSFSHFPGSQASSQFSLVDVRSFGYSSGFVCPYPDDYPKDTFIILRSPCQPSWTEFGVLCGYGAVFLVAAFFVYLVLRKFVDQNRLQLLVYVGQWFAAVASLILDVFSLQTMMNNVLSRTDHCSPVNSYAIFSQFITYAWSSMPPSAPNTPFSVWNQQFIDFGRILPSDTLVTANLQAFRVLCSKIPECGVDSIGTSCVIVHPELASSGQAAFSNFFACLITVIALRCLIELCRMCIVFWSLWICHIKFADYGALFIGRSVFAPLLYFRADTRSEFSDMLIHRKVPLTHQQFVLELVNSALLSAIPLLAASVFYISVVAQTGVTASNLVSIMFTSFNTCVLIGRAIYVWIASLMDARNPPTAATSSSGPDVPDVGLDSTADLLGASAMKSDDLRDVAIELSDTANPFADSQPVLDAADNAATLQSSDDGGSDSVTKVTGSNSIDAQPDTDTSAFVQSSTSDVSGSDSTKSDNLSPPSSRRSMSPMLMSDSSVVPVASVDSEAADANSTLDH
jgi:Leucine-rich repeat (LRR) protein